VPSSGLPAKVIALWHHRWEGPKLRDWPADVQATVNHVICGLAQAANPNTGTGHLSYAPAPLNTPTGQSVADHAADIRAFIARGCNVVLGFGGSSDGGITITTNTNADQAEASIVGLVNTYGFNGIDIDLEPSGSNWTEPALLRLVTNLKTRYGAGFLIGVTPGLYQPWTDRWMSFMKAAGNNVDYIAPMLYDFPEAGDSRLSAVAVNKCDVIVNAGIPASKIILGFMMRPNASYLNATPSPSLTTAAWQAAKAKHPGVRGVFVWEDKIEAANNWWFTRATGAAVKA
jgi:chitinase